MGKTRCGKCGKKYGATSPKCPTCGSQTQHLTHAGRRISFVVCLAILAVAATVGALTLSRSRGRPPLAPPHSIPTLADLMTVSPDAIPTCRWDVAMLNIVAAEGLPGAESVDTNACMALLDRWTDLVRSVTDQNMHRFRENPAEYNKSLAYYKTGMLMTVLAQDIGVKYNMALIESGAMSEPTFRFFADSRDIFIHGVLSDRKTGTCANLPVLVVAIGRRLGYPLKLVTTAAHQFCRWDDGVEYQNFEFNQTGVVNEPDSHYMTFPHPITLDMMNEEGFLRSMTPRDEVASVLIERALCLLQNKRYGEAKDALMRVRQLRPSSKMSVTWSIYAAEMEASGGSSYSFTQ